MMMRCSRCNNAIDEQRGSCKDKFNARDAIIDLINKDRLGIMKLPSRQVKEMALAIQS